MTFIDRLDYLQSRVIQLKIYFTKVNVQKPVYLKLVAHIEAMEDEIDFIEDMPYKEAVKPLDTINDLIIESK